MYSVFAGLLPPDLLALSTGYYLIGTSSETPAQSHTPIALWHTRFYKPRGSLYSNITKYGLLVSFPSIPSTTIVNSPTFILDYLTIKQSVIPYVVDSTIRYTTNNLITYSNNTTSISSPRVRIKKGRKNGTIFIKDNE